MWQHSIVVRVLGVAVKRFWLSLIHCTVENGSVKPSHTHVSVIKQCDFVLEKGQRCFKMYNSCFDIVLVKMYRCVRRLVVSVDVA